MTSSRDTTAKEKAIVRVATIWFGDEWFKNSWIGSKAIIVKNLFCYLQIFGVQNCFNNHYFKKQYILSVYKMINRIFFKFAIHVV